MSETEYRPEDPSCERYKAVRWHTGVGPHAVAMLCRALEDPWVDVRTAAAERLVKIGTSEATEPLLRALRLSAGGRWSMLMITGSSFVLLPVGFLLLVTAWVLLPSGCSLLSVFFLAALWLTLAKSALKARREREDLLAAISEALAAIAEREPSPAARAAIGELKVLAADVVQQGAESRSVCVKAAERIDRATRNLERLPVAVAGPGVGSDQLPRAAEGPEVEEKQLPVVRDGISPSG